MPASAIAAPPARPDAVTGAVERGERLGTMTPMGSSDATASDAILSRSERTARSYVVSVVLPVWIASGSADYLLHRRAGIERTAGAYESRLHLAGIGLSALPVLGGLLLEINAGVILAMGAGYVAHLAMTIWDVHYASGRRSVGPLEQHVHGLLEVIPFTALSLVFCTYPEQALALVGRGKARADFRFIPKRVPLPRRSLVLTVVAFVAFVALPFVEELVRCERYERRARSDPRAADSR